MKLAFFLIFIIPLILVSIWFGEGYILGAAEAELPFYNLKLFADRTAWAWNDFQLGYVSSFTVASNPTWSFLAWFQNIGIPGFLIQAAVFYSLFVVSGIGIFLLTRELFPNINPLANLLSVLFYWFNPISLANVWNRFLYNFMSFFALLPVTLYLFLRGIHKREYKYIILVNLSLLMFSFALTSYVFNLLIWSVFAYTTFFYCLQSEEKSKIIFNIKFFSLTFFLYVLFNLWWMLPTFNLFSSESSRQAVTGNVFTSEGNVQTLQLLSQKLGNFIDITRFMHFGFYHGEGPAWSSTYNNWYIVGGLFVISIVLFWSILNFKKERSILYLGVLFTATLILSKGSNPPFGEVFKFFFEKLTFLQVFRNPFEKFSFLLQVAAAPILGYGIFKLGNSITKRWFKGIVYLASTLIVVILLGYPFFTGLVFTGPSFPNNNYSIGYRVEVPSYYQEADQWLNNQGKNFRFIGFPLGGEGITYKWTKGYQGVELSNTLFSTPNILFNTTGPYYYQVVDRLEELLFKEDNFFKIATNLNAKYLMIRSDINHRIRSMRDPKSVENRLNSEEFEQIKKVSQFGNISFYQNLNWEDRTVFVKPYLVEVRPSSLIDDLLLEEVGESSIVYQDISNLGLKNSVNTLILHPATKSQIDLNNVEYEFNISEDGDYDLLLDNNYLTKSNDFKLSIDGNVASSSAKLRDDNKIFYNKYFFKKGIHKLVFNSTTVNNLITIPQTFIMNNLNNDLSLEINDFDPYAKYFVIFDVLITKGPGFVFGLEEGSQVGERISLHDQFVSSDAKFTDFRQIVSTFPLSSHPEKGSHPEKVRFFLKVDPQISSEVMFENVFLGKFLEFSPLLIKKIKDPDTSFQTPSISYIKHNPAKYSVKISNANQSFVLIFSDLYNPSWEAKYEDGKIIDKHFMVNSFANGWLVEKGGNYEVSLEFAPQKLLELGSTVSRISFIGTLLYIGGGYLLRKRSMKNKLWK